MAAERRGRYVVGTYVSVTQGLRPATHNKQPSEESDMGKGIDMARPHAPEHAAALDDMKDQLLIVLIKRLGGKVTIPVAEIDGTGNDLLAFSVDPVARTFRFVASKKS